jgi:WD40 repeat protein
LPKTGSSFEVRSLSFLENRKLAASYGDGTVRIWDLFRRQSLQSFKGHSEPILTSSALDWIYLATSSNRDILIWDSQNASLVKNLTGHSGYVYRLMKMQNGLLLSASADKTIKVWNVSEWSLVRTIDGHLDAVSRLAELSYDSVASGSRDGEIKVWSTSEWTNLRSWQAHSSPIISLVLLPKQKYLASLNQDKDIKIWDFNEASLVKTLKSDKIIYSIAALRNGDLVSASGKGYIELWDVEKGSIRKTAFYGSNMIWCLALDTKGRIAMGMGNGDIRILNILNL